MKSLKSLCFILGAVASANQMAHAAEAGLSFRNANLIGPGDNPEPCDRVCGHIPASYKDPAKWPEGQTPEIIELPKDFFGKPTEKEEADGVRAKLRDFAVKVPPNAKLKTLRVLLKEAEAKAAKEAAAKEAEAKEAEAKDEGTGLE